MAQRRLPGDPELDPQGNPYARQALVDQLGSGGKTYGGPSKTRTIASAAGETGLGLAQQAAGVGAGAGMAGIGLAANYFGNKLKPKEQQASSGDFGEYTDQFARRQEGTGPGVAGGAVKGAGYGSLFGAPGAAVGAGIGALTGLFTKNAPTANTDFRNEDAATAIGALYQNELGRQASPEEIATHLKNQGSQTGDRWVGQDNLFSTLQNIRNSPEAQSFATGGGTAPTTAGGAEPVARPLGADNIERDALVNQLGTGGTAGSLTGGNTGITGGLGLNVGAADQAAAPAASGGGSTSGAVPPGWDAEKVAAGHNSPKYAAREGLVALSSQLQGIPDEAGRKAAAEQTLRGMIPQLEAAGGKVLDVKGEKILLDANDGKGPLWIDTIQDIGGKAAPQWIEPDGGGDTTAGGMDTGGGAPTVDLSGQDNTLAQILEQIRLIQAGTPDRGALLSQMGG